MDTNSYLGGLEVVAATGAHQPAQLLRMTAARPGVSSGCVLSKYGSIGRINVGQPRGDGLTRVFGALGELGR